MSPITASLSIASPSITNASADANFWAASYRGRDIAAHRQSQGWHVYLDRVMQPNKLFVCAEDAAQWLRRKVDGRDIDPLSFAAARMARPRAGRSLRKAA